MKGGFQIVNFKNLALTSASESNIKGVYDAIANANGKRTIIHNMNVGSTHYKDFTVYFTAGENQFTGETTVGNETISFLVKVGDDVTVTIA